MAWRTSPQTCSIRPSLSVLTTKAGRASSTDENNCSDRRKSLPHGVNYQVGVTHVRSVPRYIQYP
ncbi:hypothetical protein Ttaiw_02558 [Tepidimonas taiwanensis]|uniref:Uncharacterized protein n=1 Tax=Tepidimonas taiwanensis TaxID=307486 RepID=A0A554WYF2_9BURK|nr:hypothetical protein Ttaiw_02558 [Tepidimonas taiwanensis]